ncbi:MAG: ADP-heptose--LPS heptosyltransferase I [Gammaproteobacteria bacterium]|nr:MAG: ADP-heptose--LPS heptosyltransferase I [Gammaproteobacteria bacterium]
MKNNYKNICILRLSAIGDVCHTLAVINKLQSLPDPPKITWIVGKNEMTFLEGLSGVDFIVFDKKKGIKEFWQLYQKIKNKKFDILFHMQMAMRASLISMFIKAPVKLGFAKKNSKDMQYLWTNNKIKYITQSHILETMLSFCDYLNLPKTLPKFSLPPDKFYPLPPNPTKKQILLICPCSVHSYRNWSVSSYAEIAKYALKILDLQVIIAGGNTKIEKEYGDYIQQKQHKVINLVGKTELKQLLYIIKKSSAVLCVDSAPAHMATLVATPVIGLYACTNPDRARPYYSQNTTIDRYQEAVMAKHNKSAKDLKWGLRVKDPGTMNRITIEDVVLKLHQIFT